MKHLLICFKEIARGFTVFPARECCFSTRLPRKNSILFLISDPHFIILVVSFKLSKNIYNVKVKIVQSKFLWKDLLIVFQPVKFWSINKLSKKTSYWEKYQLRNMSSPESRGIRMSVPSSLHKFTVSWKVDDIPYCL